MEHEKWLIFLVERKEIDSKWVYKVKCDRNRKVMRLKARIVARGDKQVKGKDHKDTFSPIAKFSTVRILIALAIIKKLEATTLRCEQCFLALIH